jgi:hypothetical protein
MDRRWLLLLTVLVSLFCKFEVRRDRPGGYPGADPAAAHHATYYKRNVYLVASIKIKLIK